MSIVHQLRNKFMLVWNKNILIRFVHFCQNTWQQHKLVIEQTQAQSRKGQEWDRKIVLPKFNPTSSIERTYIFWSSMNPYFHVRFMPPKSNMSQTIITINFKKLKSSERVTYNCWFRESAYNLDVTWLL